MEITKLDVSRTLKSAAPYFSADSQLLMLKSRTSCLPCSSREVHHFGPSSSLQKPEDGGQSYYDHGDMTD